MAARDHNGASVHYREAVRREPERVELWLKLADTQQALGRKSDAAAALEEVLKRKPAMWDKRTQLMDYYLEAADGNAAKRHLQTGMGMLPDDVPLVSRFATYAERLSQPQDALRLWGRAIELDVAYEPGHFAVARLYKDSGNWAKALAAAEAGMAAAKSARLAALEADALTALDRTDDARLFLRAVTAQMKDRELLARAADFEDRYGGAASKYYWPLVEALRGAGEAESNWRAVAERGCAPRSGRTTPRRANVSPSFWARHSAIRWHRRQTLQRSMCRVDSRHCCSRRTDRWRVPRKHFWRTLAAPWRRTHLSRMARSRWWRSIGRR